MTEDPSHIVPRKVAVAIPFRRSAPHFLLVSSRKHINSWIFPKGQIEPQIDSHDPRQAALREAWEEAGIKGKAIRWLHHTFDTKPHKLATDNGFVPRAEYTFWLVEVIEEFEDWPERSERHRKWVDRSEAMSLVSWRRDGQTEALEKVTVKDLA